MGLFRRRLSPGGLCRRLDNCNNSERSSRKFIKTSSPNNTEKTNLEDMIYQFDGQRTMSSFLGHKEFTNRHFWVSILTECLSCYIYVFITCSTRISWTGSVIGHEPNLLSMAFSSGLAMMLLILTFRTVHVNPALTIAFLLTGRIPLVRAILYVFVHCLGSLAAITSLYSVSVKGHAGALGLDNPHEGLRSWQILIVEMVISFVVTLTTYATCNYSSYASARKFVLEQALIGQNTNSGLMFYDLFPTTTSSTCDNILSRPDSDLQQISQLAQLNRQMNGLATAPHLPNSTRPVNNKNFRVHPRPTHTNGGTFLTDMLGNANEEIISSDYGIEYENGRIYANSEQRPKHQDQLLSSNSDSSPMGSATAQTEKPPIEELMQDESQLLATNGFSLHVTVGQAFVIGLAYTLTSLSGLPASGASLNPARSFGPAFIMSRWDHQWIYWVGPIVGAAIAGFFYEFIFNPTKKSSLCYVPKLFRLSAHDMAKVCSKSRLFHHQHNQKYPHQRLSPPIKTATGNLYPTAPSVYRPNLHHQMLSTIQCPPVSESRQNNGAIPSGFISSATIANHHHHHQQPQQHPLTQLQASHLPINANSHIGGDNSSFSQHHHQTLINEANFDRTKSNAAILTLIANKKQQSIINLPQLHQGVSNNLHSASSSNGSNSQVSTSHPLHQHRPDFDLVAFNNDANQHGNQPALIGHQPSNYSSKMIAEQQQQQQALNRHSMAGLTGRRLQLSGHYPLDSVKAVRDRPQSMQFASYNNDDSSNEADQHYQVPDENVDMNLDRMSPNGVANLNGYHASNI